MPWVLDGNNLARGQDRERVRRAALALARSERIRIIVFFDGAPPTGVPPVERLGQVEVRYVPNADAAILELLRRGGRGWRLASDDRDLGIRARTTGAEVVAGGGFWARVEHSRGGEEAEAAVEPGPGGHLAAAERLPAAPVRVRRSPRTRRQW
jgi:hypothetical protein